MTKVGFSAADPKTLVVCRRAGFRAYAGSVTPSRIARTRGGHVWGEAWRLLSALAIGLVMWGSVLYTNFRTDRVPEWGAHWIWADLTLGLVAAAVSLWRRHHHLAVAVVTTAISAVSVVAIGPAALAVVSLAATRRWRPLLVVAPLWFAAQWSSLAVYRAWETSGFWPNVVIAALSLFLCVAVGFYIGERRAYVASLRERALTAEREQALRVMQARVAERTRIAREMHDVLAHRISLVAMHSGALSYRTDLAPEQVAQTAEVIRTNAHRALGELREVLGVLRDVPGADGGGPDDASGSPEAPQPTLADLDELLDEARALGAGVETEVQGDLAAIPASASRTAYRIIQECLTNARKHAPGRPVHVTLVASTQDHGKGTLSMTVRNGIRPESAVGDGAGLGLVGLTERAVLASGELTYGPDAQGDWVVRARLPWTT